MKKICISIGKSKYLPQQWVMTHCLISVCLFFSFSSVSHAFFSVGDDGAEAAFKLSPYVPEAGIAGVSFSRFFSQWDSNVNFVSGIEGAQLASLFAFPELDPSSSISKKMALLRTMEDLVEMDVRDQLSKSESRIIRMEEIEALFSSVISDGEYSEAVLIAQEEQLETRFSEQESLVDTAEDEYFSFLDAYRADLSQTELQKFITYKKELVEIRAEYGQASELRKKFSDVLPEVQEKLDAIQKNREALIAGVQVDGRTAREMGLVK